VALADRVAALDAGFGGGAAVVHSRHDHAVRGAEVELARHVRGDRPDVHAQRRFRSALAVGATGLALFGSLADLDVDGLLPLVTPDLHLGAVAGVGETDSALQIPRALHLLAVELDEDVTGLQPGLGRGAVADDVRDEHTLVVLRVERLGQLRCQRLDGDPKPAARDFSLGQQLGVDLPGHVRWNGKADAGAAGDDRCVDADDLALHVHEWAAGVAGIDRGVGLDEVVERALTDLAGLGADDPGRDRGLKPERGADRDDPVADLHLVGVAEPNRRELALAVVQAEHGEVRLLVEADDLRLVLAAVERDDLDLGGALDL